MKFQFGYTTEGSHRIAGELTYLKTKLFIKKELFLPSLKLAYQSKCLSLKKKKKCESIRRHLYLQDDSLPCTILNIFSPKYSVSFFNLELPLQIAQKIISRQDSILFKIAKPKLFF